MILHRTHKSIGYGTKCDTRTPVTGDFFAEFTDGSGISMTWYRTHTSLGYAPEFLAEPTEVSGTAVWMLYITHKSIGYGVRRGTRARTRVFYKGTRYTRTPGIVQGY